uniref:NADH-ubiquinone oxidoreductase chain 2 n=1 Tax=Mezira sp. TaxID=2931906 RepID=A0A8T9VZH4_9HEMI|nr:NADH dehydrogenase subunit 2 [Mezira sp.]
MKFNNASMIVIMLLSTLMVMSSNNWFSMWMGMEINLMSFIPILKMNNKESSNNMMIYFLSQSMGSMLFLYTLLATWLTPSNHEQLMMSMIMVSMMIKLGMPPAHTWMIMMLNNMDWMNCLLLMTVQKLAPMTVMYSMTNMVNETFIIVTIATIIGTIGGINQTSLRKMMGYSSISHTGWMVMLTTHNTLWMSYFTIYTMIVFMICFMLNNESIFFLNQLNMMKLNNKISFSINMISMSGLPPMMGFVPKWIAIQYLINSNMTVIAFIMVMTSLLSLYFYMTMVLPSLTMESTTIKMMPKTEKTYSMMTILSLTMPLFLTLNILI